MTALPLGLRRIDALRTLTTEALAVLMPFKAQEVRDQGGVYYGQNVISKNLIIANRKELLNGNGFVLGVSGSGKSFTAKREMVNLALSTEDDIIVIDPESEYRPLIEGLGGEVISISATSPNHINAMDMEQGYGDGENPVVLKSEFLLSLCEQLMGDRLLSAKEKSIIDRCTASVYHSYIKGGYQGKAPTLQDFHAELLRQSEPEARDVALHGPGGMGLEQIFHILGGTCTQCPVLSHPFPQSKEKICAVFMLKQQRKNPSLTAVLPMSITATSRAATRAKPPSRFLGKLSINGTMALPHLMRPLPKSTSVI